MEKKISIGLCGLGTVGSGVFKLLQENKELIKNRVGADLCVTKIATIDPYDHLGLDFSNVTITNSVEDILSDPDISVVVELIGGKTIAKDIVLKSLQAGRSVVTANKALLAEYSEDIFRAAYQSSGYLGYEASVAGGIPIIRSVKQGFSGDRIDEISGIVNGTANYILSSMTEKSVDFQSALKTAQDKGFAEADPTYDIEGIDAAHKLLILMQLAYHKYFKFNQLYIEGITGIEPIDIRFANELGYTIKLLATTRRTSQGYEGRVHPALVNHENMLASVKGAFNAVSVYGNFVGHTLSYGAGAGSYPTASAVVSDIIDTARFQLSNQKNPVPPLSYPMEKMEPASILPIDQIQTEYYLRISASEDAKGPNSIIAILAEYEIGIRSLVQKDAEELATTDQYIVILTGIALESSMQSALKRIDALPFVNSSKAIRINR